MDCLRESWSRCPLNVRGSVLPSLQAASRRTTEATPSPGFMRRCNGQSGAERGTLLSACRGGWRILVWAFVPIAVLAGGCTATHTFPKIARAGDTVSVMIGGSEKARKDTVNVTLTHANGGTWDLVSLGLVRSVFNLRPDGRAEGLHYSPYLDTFISWSSGHEPVQTVLVADLPADVLPGDVTLTISLNVDDNSSGISDPTNISLEVIGGTGGSDQFLRKNPGVGRTPAELAKLEPAPHAKISFGKSGSKIYAASLIVDFDETVVNPEDINVYSPESTVRGAFISTGAFGQTQRMMYWHQDGQQLYINTIAPQGIEDRYLQVFVIHPPGLGGPAGLNLTSATGYDVNGNVTVISPVLEYFP